MQFAIHGFRKLNLYIMPNVDVAYLTPNDALVADLPVDYEKYLKIGVNVGGKIWTLTVANDGALSRKYDCGEEVSPAPVPLSTVLTTQDVSDVFWYVPHFRNGQYVGEMFSQGGGLNAAGYYRIDNEKNRIQFYSVVPKTEIYLEYKSNGLDKNGKTLIPSAAIDPIRAYIHWQLAEFDKTVSESGKARKKQIYEDAYELFNFYNWHFTEDEYYDHTYEHIKQTIKR
jgi:hypothetical protein